ncbi:MAG: hemerythrin family protein [Nitrospiraceae bacterium]|nr:hemerythrin family protein [Nitrospiraceae bacterium]
MLQWTTALSVGVIEIDSQHKELISRVNNFLTSVEDHKGPEEIKKLFGFLQDYIKYHFSTEENYMDHYALYGYSNRDRHKAEHKAFIRDFTEFKKDIDFSGADQLMIKEFCEWIYNWYVLHIQKTDKDLAEVLKKSFPFMST